MNTNDKTTSKPDKVIPVHNLKMQIANGKHGYLEEKIPCKIEGLEVVHKVYIGEGQYNISLKDSHATFFLVLKGTGVFITDNEQQSLEEASIVLAPIKTHQPSIKLKNEESLHLLEFSKSLSKQDKTNLQSQENQLNQLYYTKYKDCAPYTEKIKSPSTVSRTILPGGIIPRVALGTVEAAGPDRVGAHSHPMLEQLFLGLTDNQIIVHADGVIAEMNAFSLLHIPLGSTHSVEVAANCKMNYMWMDFFLTKDGEAWLDTHKHIKESVLD